MYETHKKKAQANGPKRKQRPGFQQSKDGTSKVYRNSRGYKYGDRPMPRVFDTNMEQSKQSLMNVIEGYNTGSGKHDRIP